ncbi:MAG: hypothetical protein D6767_04335, partial [Candidatus Hydrogenedentota bacterium]
MIPLVIAASLIPLLFIGVLLLVIHFTKKEEAPAVEVLPESEDIEEDLPEFVQSAKSVQHKKILLKGSKQQEVYLENIDFPKYRNYIPYFFSTNGESKYLFLSHQKNDSLENALVAWKSDKRNADFALILTFYVHATEGIQSKKFRSFLRQVLAYKLTSHEDKIILKTVYAN